MSDTLTTEQVEAIHDDTLWSVNIQGPDDVFAAKSRAEAIDLATKFNEWWVLNFAAKGLHPYDPTLWAVPTPWRYDEASHARSLADTEGEYAWLRDPSVPPIATELLALRKRVGALVHWLENNQPDVFRRGLWDAVNSAPQDATQADRRMENLNRHIAASPSPQKGEAGVRDGIEIAAQWHEAEAERIRLLALDSDEPHRFHEAQDDHLSHAALIRALPLPTPKEAS